MNTSPSPQSEPAPRRGMVVVISGPSGVGKDTVLKGVFRKDSMLRQCVTVTTRKPRPGELDGKDYHFRTEEEFRQLLSTDYFLEWAAVHTAHYGTPAEGVEALRTAGYDVVLKIDVQGCAAVVQRLPDLVTIFIAPPSLQELEARQRKRATEGGADLKKRQEDARVELACMSSYQYVVTNGILDQAVEDILCILRAERLRVTRFPGLR